MAWPGSLLIPYSSPYFFFVQKYTRWYTVDLSDGVRWCSASVVQISFFRMGFKARAYK